MPIRFDAVRQASKLGGGLDLGPTAQVKGRLLLRGAKLGDERHHDDFMGARFCVEAVEMLGA